MTISETAVQPAAGSHPYPDPSVLPVDFYKDTAVRYERIGAKADANIARWYAQARKKVLDPEPEEAPDPLPRRSHAATAVTQPDPVPAPYVPAPQPLPEPESGPPLTGRQRRFFSGRVKHEPPVRDQPPAEVPETWQEPQQGERRGRHAAPEAPVSGRSTVPPPAAEGDDEPTLLPGLPGAIDPVPALDPKQAGRLARFNAAHDDEPPAGDWVDHDADRAASSGFFDTPDQGDQK